MDYELERAKLEAVDLATEFLFRLQRGTLAVPVLEREDCWCGHTITDHGPDGCHVIIPMIDLHTAELTGELAPCPCEFYGPPELV